MTTRQIILNTLVYNDANTAGILQADMLPDVASLGIKATEVRREFFKDISTEISALSLRAQDEHMEIYFSIPDMLFLEGGVLNPMFTQYVAEARALKATAMKMNIGHFEAASEATLEEFKSLLPADILLNVENDQTQLNGTMQPIKTFLAYAQGNDIKVKFVFDAANWRFVGEDELIAADLLAEYTSILHIKNVVTENEKLKVVAFDKGDIDWKLLISKLPTNIPVFLEYPSTQTDLATDIATLNEVIN